MMTATYEALCACGYTDLTAQAIADRTDKSKSRLFYHYDSLEDLIVDFIDYLIERFDERTEETADLPPLERLERFVDWFLYGPDDTERVSFHTALLELRAQAPYNERYREQLRRTDARLRETLESILEDGQASGDFRDHDASRTASLLIAAFDGARVRQLTLERDAYLEDVRDGVTTMIIAGILADGVEFPTGGEPTDEDDGECDG